MTPFPLSLPEALGPVGTNLLYLLIGVGFGVALEMSGFGNSTRLAAQFYLKDQTVIKVMFTAIVVAMLLIVAASAAGLLDTNLIWVNPTYLWPGIVGGLIMGVGFIIGGFCPGTSLVAAATLKIDGLFFLLGSLFGMFVFGETVGLFDGFWHSSYLGRLTLPELLNLDAGVVALLVVLMALFAFWGVEQLERVFGKKDPKQAPRWRYSAAAVALLLGSATAITGQPTIADRWQRMAAEKEPLLTERAVYVHPGEALALMRDDRINLRLLDLRSETDFNRFHLLDAERVAPELLTNRLPALQTAPTSTVVILMSNDETAATQAWRLLQAGSVPNVYILEGGVNGWLATFAADDPAVLPAADTGDERLNYTFAAALGGRHAAANPNPRDYVLEYEEKVRLAGPGAARSGGCG